MRLSRTVYRQLSKLFPNRPQINLINTCQWQSIFDENTAGVGVGRAIFQSIRFQLSLTYTLFMQDNCSNGAFSFGWVGLR